jgi:hypothetical protein
MEILNLLSQYGILDIAVVIGIISIMTQLRKQFLDTIIEIKEIKQGWLKWTILAIISLILSIGLTALVHIPKFNWLNWLKMSGLNFVFSYALHDTIKNLFFKES